MHNTLGAAAVDNDEAAHILHTLLRYDTQRTCAVCVFSARLHTGFSLACSVGDGLLTLCRQVNTYNAGDGRRRQQLLQYVLHPPSADVLTTRSATRYVRSLYSFNINSDTESATSSASPSAVDDEDKDEQNTNESLAECDSLVQLVISFLMYNMCVILQVCELWVEPQSGRPFVDDGHNEKPIEHVNTFADWHKNVSWTKGLIVSLNAQSVEMINNFITMRAAAAAG
jgi:hypothetical protein